MAIDSRSKRASIASLGLAFLGASVVPTGTIAAADRLTVGHSYYGIAAGSGQIELGATSQIGAYAASGVLTIEQVLGATSQIGAYDATGVLTVEQALGATSQLGAYSASGVIQVGEVVEVDEDQPTGGWSRGGFWRGYERERERLLAARKKRKEVKEEAQEIEDELDRALAMAERKIEEREARDEELARLTALVEEHKDEVAQISDRINEVTERALSEQTFQTLEIMEREFRKIREEEEFLAMATRIILNA